MTTIHDVVCTTFTFECPWGCTVQVERGKEQPHACAGVSLLVDAMRATPSERLTVLEHATRLANLLEPEVRTLRHKSWGTAVHDGRSGERFFGIDADEADGVAE